MNSSFKEIFKSVDAVLVTSIANIVYLTGFDGFSETERECFLVITKNKNYLITDKRYSQAAKLRTKNFEIIDTGAQRFILKNAGEFFKKTKTVGFEDYDLTVSEYSKLKKLAKLRPLNLKNLRIIKREEEIKNIKLACKIGDQAFKFILDKLRLGLTEQKISNQLEFFIKQKTDVSFKPIVAFGKHSSVPHHLCSKTKLKNNQIVLLDFGVKVNNYCSDMSRTVFFGKASEKFKKMHQTVLLAQQKAIEYINSQLLIVNGQLFAKDIDKIARDYITDQGFPNIIHSVGHGVGIQVHEPPHLSPNSKDIIKENMVFSVEPGIYLPKVGGVRIEDLVLVTKNGAELISHANREIIEI